MKSWRRRDKFKVRMNLLNIIEKWIEVIKNLEEHNNNFMLIFELSIQFKFKSGLMKQFKLRDCELVFINARLYNSFGLYLY